MTTLSIISVVLFSVALLLIVANLVNELFKAVPVQKLAAYLFAAFAGSFLVMGIVATWINLF